MATLDPITGLPSSNTQIVYAGDRPINQTFQVPSAVSPSPINTNATFDQIATTTRPVPSFTQAAPVINPAITTGIVNRTNEQIVADQQAALANSVEQQNQNSLSSEIQKYLGLSGTPGFNEQKAAEQATLMQSNDVVGKAAAVKGIIDKINANKVLAQVGGTATNVGGLTQGQYTADIESKNLLLGAQLLVAQGQYDSARDAVTQAIDMKYAPQEARYNALLKYYDVNAKALGDKGAQMKELTTAKLADIADKKTKDEAINQMIIKASESAPLDVLKVARDVQAKGGDALSVATVLGKYGGDYLTREKIKAEIRKMDADAAKTRADARAVGTSIIAGEASSNAKAWLAQYNSGALSLEDIYTKIGSTKEAAALKNEVARLVAAQGGKRVYGMDDASVQAINSQIKNIDDLLKGDVGSIVGLVQGGLAVLPDRLNIYKQDAIAVAQNLVANQTLQALADAKAKGVTFGALSEAELNAVAASASRISAKLKKDKEGNITGFSGSESEFKNDLNAVRKGLEKSIEQRTQSVGQADKTADDIMTANSAVQKEISGTYNLFGK